MISIKHKLWLKKTLKPFFKKALTKYREKKAINMSSLPSEGTHYHDVIDHNLLNELSSYETEPSSLSIDDVKYNVNYNFFSAYGPDFTQKDCLALSTDTPLDYERLLKNINKLPNVKSGTFAHYLPERKLAEDEIACIVRHDVDGDLVAALQQAKIENKFGFKTSYYILHTAPYYGVFKQGGVFARNEACISVYQEIQALGHEIALHTDGMLVYQDQGRDGAQCLKSEISWLRENGVQLTGTTAHNSWPSYGVENFSIFEGKDRGKGEGKKAVTHNGKWAPIGVVNEKEIGLEYEANELLWQNETPVFYAALRSQNIWRVDLFNYPKELSDEQYEFGRLIDFKNTFVSTDDLFELLKLVKAPAYLYLVVHPMHYGLRPSYDHEPWLPQVGQSVLKKGISLTANTNDNDEIISCAISKENEFGTFDRGLDCYVSAMQRIIVFGEINLANDKVSVDSKFSQVASQFFARASKVPRTAAIGVASEINFIAKYERCFKQIQNKAKCDYIILLIDFASDEANFIVTWLDELQKTDEKVVVIAKNTDSIEQGIVNKESVIYTNAIFNEYKGSASLYIDEENGIWSVQGHHLIGKAVASTLIKKYFQ